MPDGLGKRIAEALERLTAIAPTVIPAVEDCGWCHHGTMNVGTAIDPEPGPCSRCRCWLHRESHPDCSEEARVVLQEVQALIDNAEAQDRPLCERCCGEGFVCVDCGVLEIADELAALAEPEEPQPCLHCDLCASGDCHCGKEEPKPLAVPRYEVAKYVGVRLIETDTICGYC